MTSVTVALPLRMTVGDEPKSKNSQLAQDCILRYGFREWCIPIWLVCEASPVLQQLLTNTEKLSKSGIFTFGPAQNPSKSAGANLFGTAHTSSQSTGFGSTGFSFGPAHNSTNNTVSLFANAASSITSADKKECFDLTRLASINQANGMTVRAVIDFIQNSELVLRAPSEPKLTLAELLRRCAEIYVLASNLQISVLETMALETWTEKTNTLHFGALRAVELTNLAQYVFSSTTRYDAGLRRAVIKFAASYNQKYLSMYDSVLTSKRLQNKCRPTLYKDLFLYQSQFAELDSLLTSEEPQAWELAKAYEERLQQLDDLLDR